MAERLNTKASEKYNSRNLERSGDERRKELEAKRNEALEQRSPEKSVSERSKEAQELARSHEKESRKEQEDKLAYEKRREQLSRQPRSQKAAFNKEMKRVQSQLSAPSKAFSKVIHNPAIEKVSNVTGSTIARPNAILSGSVAAFFLTGSLYAWASYAGHPLSGFESIAAFIIGWLIGIIFDYTRIMATGKR
ncbi:hypothetical protein H6796_00990 [Candidatus Nomurabacteria bacterium]|nr:hypothetical protein [Candidatus Nomurabacteria bacterium]